ncbi:MAG: DUF3592 domain-containing protein [bacterium]|nr:DUF3592 domain-containing protein [bacterium]
MNTKKIGWVLGLIIIGWGVSLIFDSYTIQQTHLKTFGTIVNVKARANYFFSDVEFKTPDGISHTFRNPRKQFYIQPKVGSAVTVFYDPKSLKFPYDSIKYSRFDFYIFPILIMFFGLLVFLGGHIPKRWMKRVG